MTDVRDLYSTRRTPGRSESPSSGMLWGGLALIAILALIAVFFLFGSTGPDNGTGAPDLSPPQAETAEPAPDEPATPVQ